MDSLRRPEVNCLTYWRSMGSWAVRALSENAWACKRRMRRWSVSFAFILQTYQHHHPTTNITLQHSCFKDDLHINSVIIKPPLLSIFHKSRNLRTFVKAIDILPRRTGVVRQLIWADAHDFSVFIVELFKCIGNVTGELVEGEGETSEGP